MATFIDDSAVAAVLAKVRQMAYSEMIEGNGRQPAEVVEYVGMELAALFAVANPDFDRGAFYDVSEPELRDELIGE